MGVNQRFLHHEDLSDFIWLSTSGANHPCCLLYWGEGEGGQEDLHLRLHLHRRRQRQGKRHWILRQEVQRKCQGNDIEQCHILLHLRIRCQEGQGQGGED